MIKKVQNELGLTKYWQERGSGLDIHLESGGHAVDS